MHRALPLVGLMFLAGCSAQPAVTPHRIVSDNPCVDAILAEQPAGTEMKKDAAVQKAAELLSMPYTPSLTQRYYREKRRQEKRERQDEEFQQMMSKYQVKLPLNLD